MAPNSNNPTPNTQLPIPVYLFLRDPWSGPVKSRLAAGCGEEPARNLYILMTEMLARDLAPREGDPHHLNLYVSPAESLARVMEWLFPDGAYGVTAIPQPETTLDRRMQHALDLTNGPVILLGTDCPGISRGDLARIGAMLEVVDAVLGPANDGGFWTLGLARPQPRLLDDLPTSDPGTLDALRERLHARGLRTVEIEERTDIDILDDLASIDPAVRLRLAAQARLRAMLLPEGIDA